jgi:Protein of unknown function, DUF547
VPEPQACALRREIIMRQILVLALVLLLPEVAGAAPAAKLWPYWERHGPASSAPIDHAAWTGFLERYVRIGDDGINRVAYGEVTPEDRAALDAYIDRLARLPIRSYARPEQMAYWINLYNALTVQVVLEHYPVESIRDIDISPGLFSDGPWGRDLAMIEGQEVSLDDIEHRILRPIWQDPRIHYSVNCASIGCPDLQPEPFRADALDRQLTAAAEDYVNDPRGVLVDDSDLVVSSIYNWFGADFGGSERDLIEHLKRYARPELRARLERVRSIDDDRYDWRLNDARR